MTATRKPAPAASVSEAAARYRMRDVARVAVRASLVKSVYASVRARGKVVVGRRTKLVLRRGAHLRVNRAGVLVVGIDQHRPGWSLVEIHSGGRLTCDGIVHVSRGTRLVIGKDGDLRIGGGTFLNDDCHVICNNRSRIGGRCAISFRVFITDTDMHELVLDGEPRRMTAPFVIEDDVWIGAGATVLKGVTIGAGSVVAGSAVVTRDAPTATLVAGNPARHVRSDVSWRH